MQWFERFDMDILDKYYLEDLTKNTFFVNFAKNTAWASDKVSFRNIMAEDALRCVSTESGAVIHVLSNTSQNISFRYGFN